MAISLVEAAERRAVFEGSPAEWQYNQLATVHGGWLSALHDSALGYAVQSVLPAGRGFATLDLFKLGCLMKWLALYRLLR